ncbi:hypothetical protein L1D14_04130 [Vibrio tubiashii]|uniref:hypothetical protein n=1 Tax=Vibrio tubiashii TaxID=29498 RepID=UPI001EFDEF5A|nr:hypothetical protein [Vibrio tubiashii]MCG9575419.1 hypothetical protein [Vibrio tubiashii]
MFRVARSWSGFAKKLTACGDVFSSGIRLLVAVSILVSISGCDLASKFIANEDKPLIQIGSGTVVLIGKGEQAKMYGTNECFNSRPLGETFGRQGCTTLVGDTVKVTFVSDEKLWTENLSLLIEKDTYQLVRSNGFQIREVN